MTYEVLTGDLSKVNYSSIKAGVNEFRRSVEVLQWSTVIPMMMRPIWRSFIDMSIATGHLPADTPYDVEFTTPKFEAVDPAKETEGDIAAVRALMMAPQEAIRRRGYDPDQVLEDHKLWHEALIASGVVSDADAAQVGKAGSGAAPNKDAAESGDKQE
jgi:capsid protein